MKLTLEFPDDKAAFVLELLGNIPYLKAQPLGRKTQPQDETEYLLSSPANAKALTEAIERTRNGQTVEHDLLEP